MDKFIKIPLELLESELIKKPNAFTVYIYLVGRAGWTGEDRGKITISHGEICEAVKMSRPTLANTLKYLNDFNYIMCKKNEGNKYTYTITQYNKHQGIKK